MAGNFPVVGSQLEAQGAQEYIRALHAAAQATGSDFAREAQRGAEAMRSVADAADYTQRSVGDHLELLAVGAGELWKQFSVGMLVANGVTAAIGFVSNAVRSLIGGAQQAVAAHERLSLSMESLVARELRAADSTLSMAQAMEVAKPRTQELLEWIQQLAIQSPFDTQGVALAFRTALTYGFVSKEAQALTQAMIDFASASGQSGQVMNQIAYALGQIKARGKLVQQEINQLTNAGVAVTPILKKMGFTIGDVGKGLVSADAFLAEFVKTMNDEFGGAAKRQTETLTGLLNSLGDVQQMASRALFQPIYKEITPVLSSMISKFQALIPTLQAVGENIAKATRFVIDHKDTWLRAIVAITAGVAAFYAVVNAGAIWRAGIALVSTAVTTLVSVVGGLVAAFTWLLTPVGLVTTAITLLGVAVGGLVAMFAFTYADLHRTSKGFFEGMRDNFFEWGKNLVVSLAKGMAAAIGAVLSVLTLIGKIITGWLQGHSPPRLLPDIDKWGQGAMQTYLEGFTKADFGVLSSLSSTIGSYLRGLNLSEGDVLGRVLGARTDLTSIIDEINRTGSASEASYAKLFATIGAGNPELESYIRLSVEAAAIQDRLTAASKRYADLLKPIGEQMNDISRRREEILSAEKEKALTRLLANPHISAQAKELAQLELQELLLKRQAAAIEDQAKTETEADRERLDGLTDQLDSQQALIDSINETNMLLRQQAELARQATAPPTGGAEGGGGAGGAGGLPTEAGGLLGALPDLASQAPAMMDNIKNAIVGIIEEIKGDFAALAPKWDEMRTVWQGALLAFFEWLAGIDWGGMAAGVAQFFQNIVVAFLTSIQTMLALTSQAFGEIAVALAQTGLPPLMALSEGFDTVSGSAGDAARNVRDQIKEAEGMADSARAAGEQVGDYFSKLRDDIKGKIYVESLAAFDNIDRLMLEYGDTVAEVQTGASADLEEIGDDSEALEGRSDTSYREMTRQIREYESDYTDVQRGVSADMDTIGINANTLQSAIGVATGLMTGSWATHVAALLGYEVDMKDILFNLETRAMQFKNNLESWLNKTYTINVELNLPDLPVPPGSNSAGNTYHGNSAVSVPETNPLMPFPGMGSAAVGATITGVGVMNVQNGMDVAALRTLIIQTIQEALV